MKVEIKLLADRRQMCYNIEWPCELRIENCYRVTDIYVNNFKVNDQSSICYQQGNDTVIKFSEPNPMRWMLKLNNEYHFNRVNIQ